jgi:hypothetical protein
MLAAGEQYNIVAVAIQHTPKQESLNFAGDEIKAVLAICESMKLHQFQPQSRKTDVSSALEDC